MDLTTTRGVPPSATPTRTQALAGPFAAARVDPEAATQVIPAPPVDAGGPPPEAAAGRDPARDGHGPALSRQAAAELGMYVGAALVLVAVGGSVVRGWGGWEPGIRWVMIALAAVALLAVGLFVRLPWRRVPSARRRRAVSALLTAGVAGLALGVVSWQQSAPGAPEAGPPDVVPGVLVVLAMVAVNLVARSPISESVLLGAAAWAGWSVVPTPTPASWGLLIVLGVLWAGLGMRWARGRLTAFALGTGLALVASVGLATGPWAWPTRAVLLVAAVLGLGLFLRGRANLWLALGAGASTALAASVAGDVVEPALALLVGGLATMAVSWIALRRVDRS